MNPVDIYWWAVQARNVGWARHRNPYPLGTWQYRAWDLGWSG